VRIRKTLILTFGTALLIAATTSAFCQETNVAVPDSLIAEGIPSIRQSVIDGVGRYTEFRAASFLSWNPQRKETSLTRGLGIPLRSTPSRCRAETAVK
jgi:hypothetical protein